MKSLMAAALVGFSLCIPTVCAEEVEAPDGVYTFATKEQAIEKAGKAKYGPEHDIRAGIDRKTGEISLQRYREVVDIVEDDLKERKFTEEELRILAEEEEEEREIEERRRRVAEYGAKLEREEGPSSQWFTS